ncbi:hypothetical protein [Alkalihalobacillus sp. LMS39]|uniref:hypothetical protein n=1 Tax=Alkalihalobacillus sp. LMS39 TaxID=2924032 RepID=UPI001FB4DC89|nr:hypothetical protein [Alkalihalobacillus sp. LMS39]UOE95116.1 hypothetical protein MM271_05680 [Alkalihalobacillus sp. LMS39]
MKKIVLLLLICVMVVGCSQVADGISEEIYKGVNEHKKLIEECYQGKDCEYDDVYTELEDSILEFSDYMETEEDRKLISLIGVLNVRMWDYKRIIEIEGEADLEREEYEKAHNKLHDAMNKKRVY